MPKWTTFCIADSRFLLNGFFRLDSLNPHLSFEVSSKFLFVFNGLSPICDSYDMTHIFSISTDLILYPDLQDRHNVYQSNHRLRSRFRQIVSLRNFAFVSEHHHHRFLSRNQSLTMRTIAPQLSIHRTVKVL